MKIRTLGIKENGYSFFENIQDEILFVHGNQCVLPCSRLKLMRLSELHTKRYFALHGGTHKLPRMKHIASSDEAYLVSPRRTVTVRSRNLHQSLQRFRSYTDLRLFMSHTLIMIYHISSNLRSIHDRLCCVLTSSIPRVRALGDDAFCVCPCNNPRAPHLPLGRLQLKKSIFSGILDL